ncbi:MAG: methyltransferase [Sulfolobaceae archaeon]|nr:methyltransferase [Sulfolobaceae archaeon]
MICVKVNKKDVKKLLETKPLKFYTIDENSLIVKLEELPKADIEYEIVDCKEVEGKKKRGLKLSDLIKGIRSFQIVGDIALVSPKRSIDPEKLAESIMKVTKNVKAVYIRKRVSGELRVNEIIFAGGERRTRTIYKENGIRFVVDISKVYVNTSLSNERAKLAAEVDDHIKILDAFSGYGAITLNIAKIKQVYIVSGDLNLDGLYLLKESLTLNKNLKGLIDIIQYDARYLPFREKSFDLVIADNPTMISLFKSEICRVGKETIFYVLAHDNKEASNIIERETDWIRVNDYSKNLFIFKGKVRC